MNIWTEEEEEFLKNEGKEVLYQLAVLLERNTTVTGLLLIEPMGQSSVYVASNTLSQETQKKQNEVCKKIRKKTFGGKDWVFF